MQWKKYVATNRFLAVCSFLVRLQFGGIDILVNNASAISLTPTLQTDMKRYDLMHSINTRGTFLV